MKWVWIHGNEFTGSLSHVGNLTFLEGITLHGNDVSTTGSREGSVTKDEDGEWRVVEGVEACECCTPSPRRHELFLLGDGFGQTVVGPWSAR